MWIWRKHARRTERQRATMAVSKYRTKSGIRWAADVYQDGVRIGRKAGFTSKRAATAWEETILTSPPKSVDSALRDVCTRHLLYCENRLKPNTLSYKATAYRRFIALLVVIRRSEALQNMP